MNIQCLIGYNLGFDVAKINGVISLTLDPPCSSEDRPAMYFQWRFTTDRCLAIKLADDNQDRLVPVILYFEQDRFIAYERDAYRLKRDAFSTLAGVKSDETKVQDAEREILEFFKQYDGDRNTIRELIIAEKATW